MTGIREFLSACFKMMSNIGITTIFQCNASKLYGLRALCSYYLDMEYKSYVNFDEIYHNFEFDLIVREWGDFIDLDGKYFLYGPEYSTPACLIKLCCRLLNISESDNVLDLCSGIGSFVNYVSNNYECKTLSGVELNTEAVAISKIKSYLTNANYSINQNDAFLYESRLYSKIFANYPTKLATFSNF